MGEVNKMVVAADMVVFNYNPVDNSCHVALIRRQDNGKIALPGGVCENDESTDECAVRECKEEIDLTLHGDPILIGVFDAPNRDPRGRTLSTAYYFPLANIILPELKSGDDAKEAFWMEIFDVQHIKDWAFPDHQEMISHAYLMEFRR